MSTTKIIGILLIVAGVVGLVYGGVTYTKDTHTAKLGPLLISVQEKETIMVPVLASVAALVFGLFLVVGGRSK